MASALSAQSGSPSSQRKRSSSFSEAVRVAILVPPCCEIFAEAEPATNASRSAPAKSAKIRLIRLSPLVDVSPIDVGRAKVELDRVTPFGPPRVYDAARVDVG